MYILKRQPGDQHFNSFGVFSITERSCEGEEAGIPIYKAESVIGAAEPQCAPRGQTSTSLTDSEAAYRDVQSLRKS